MQIDVKNEEVTDLFHKIAKRYLSKLYPSLNIMVEPSLWNFQNYSLLTPFIKKFVYQFLLVFKFFAREKNLLVPKPILFKFLCYQPIKLNKKDLIK